MQEGEGARAGAVDQCHLERLCLVLLRGVLADKVSGLETAHGVALGAALAGLETVAQDLFVRLAGVGWDQLHHHRGIARRIDDVELVGVVVEAPARRRGQRQAERLVEEVLPAHDTLLAAVAVSDAFNGLQVTRTGVVVEVALVARGNAGDLLQALVVGRVRGQPVAALRHLLAGRACVVGGETLLVFQDADHIDHVLRVVAHA